MKHLLLHASMLLCGFVQLFAQEQTTQPVKCMKLTDVSVLTGLYAERQNNVTLLNFYDLAPQSALLNSDLSGYTPSNGYYFNTNGTFNMSLGFSFRNKEKTGYKAGPYLRLGLSYYSVSSMNYGLYATERKPYDTLTSTQTGQVTYIDSVINKSIYMNYITEQFRLDASLLFRTTPALRFSLFGGVGLTAGTSLNASTYIDYYRTGRTEATTPSTGNTSSTYFSNSGESTRENFTNKNCFVSSFYLPMGFDFRLGKSHEFWKQVHLFYELRPGVNYISIPELGGFVNTHMQMGFGIRVSP